ncbi:hypothetical protein GOBAR_DD24649 [Gossypium barbadense]|nr:hypothetical protein GOBAR_DD24649 [Gossypium barbadense]
MNFMFMACLVVEEAKENKKAKNWNLNYQLLKLFTTSDECCSVQLIDGDGSFNDIGIESFIKEVKLHECGLSYAVVSIMGPQSSGKSTLLNDLFYTNFREMDAFKGRSQTTKGIWMAKCAGIEPCTIDDTAFEKQSALFALAVSDIVLINMEKQGNSKVDDGFNVRKEKITCIAASVDVDEEFESSGVEETRSTVTNGNRSHTNRRYRDKTANLTTNSDDLIVKPLSTISSLGLLNRFSVKDSGALQEKTIKIRMDEAVKLLKASSPSKTVLNDIFYGKKAHV